MANEDGEDPRATLIYEESERALTEQQSVLDALRTRTGIVLTGASIASTFLGGQALKDGDLTCWSYAALAALAILGLSSIWVLLPRHDGWNFSHNVDAMLEQYVDGPNPMDADEMRIDLARRKQGYWNDNKAKLTPMFYAFDLACAALVAEVALWLIDLGTRG